VQLPSHAGSTAGATDGTGTTALFSEPAAVAVVVAGGVSTAVIADGAALRVLARVGSPSAAATLSPRKSDTAAASLSTLGTPTPTATRTPSQTPQNMNYLSGPCPYYLNLGLVGGNLLFSAPGSTAWAWSVYQCQDTCVAYPACGAYLYTYTGGCQLYDTATGFPPLVGAFVGVTKGPLCGTPCAAGSFGVPPGCVACPAGSYCVAGANFARAQLPRCGRGNYCPPGSSAPTGCPAGSRGAAAVLDTSGSARQCTGWRF
jgi:hypothetical protein